MGRGRNGVVCQSAKKLVPRRHQEIAKIYGSTGKREETKINVHEDAIEFMKNADKRQLVDFLLTSGEFHGITSTGTHFEV